MPKPKPDAKVVGFEKFFLKGLVSVREPAASTQSQRIPAISSHSSDHQSLQPESPARFAPVDIEHLLMKMRAGDRDAAAEFIVRYGSRVRRRIRGKLAPTLRRVFDSMDILSTLGRRLDLYVMSGRMQVSNEAQLWSLLFKMADHALVDKARMVRSAQHTERENSQLTARQPRRADHPNASTALEIDQCLGLLDDPIDRRVLSLWLLGDSHVEIGRQVKLGADAVRKRFKRIQMHLKQRFQAGVA